MTPKKALILGFLRAFVSLMIGAELRSSLPYWWSMLAILAYSVLDGLQSYTRHKRAVGGSQ